MASRLATADLVPRGTVTEADRVPLTRRRIWCVSGCHSLKSPTTLQRAATVAVAGYSIETPRLLLASTSRRNPHGLGNNQDQVGRYVMVQGATQTAGRFPEELRSYKAPPPEISSEQFYETDTSRGFARGFSIQTVSPLPIGWSEHVLADGHWGRALREYMRDYNHWATPTSPPHGDRAGGRFVLHAHPAAR